MAKEVKKHRGVFERPKGSRIWWIRYADQFGEEHREKVGPRSAAIAKYQQRKTEIRLDKFNPDEVKGKHRRASLEEIIDDYITSCEARNVASVRDVRQRLGWWKRLFKERSARSVVANDLETARRELMESRYPSNKQKTVRKGGRSVSTVNRYLGTLKSAFSFALKNGKVERNAVSLVKFAKENNERVRWLTEDEEHSLFKTLPKEYHSLVLIALHTGMRKSEQLRLRWSDVDFQNRHITIVKSKSGKSRHIPMNETVIDTLKSIPRMIHNPYVFYGRKPGEPLKNGVKNSDWKKCLKEAGILDFHWHDLRHTFASRLVMKGVDLYTVSKLLGHHSLKMTERYAHLAPNYLKKAVSVLSQKSQPAPKAAPKRSNV